MNKVIIVGGGAAGMLCAYLPPETAVRFILKK